MTDVREAQDQPGSSLPARDLHMANNTAKRTTTGTIASNWWYRTFSPQLETGRATRARLRRCTTPIDTITIEAVHDLHAHLADGDRRASPDQLALIAITLAHVEQDGGQRLAMILGSRQTRSTARLLSEERWARLINIERREELIAPMRRALAMIGRQAVNVRALADDLYWWSERTRIEWSYQYFGAEASAPDLTRQKEPDR